MDYNIEILHLKEELFKELRELETKFVNMYYKKNIEIEDKNKISMEKINLMMSKSEEMFNSINNQQIKLEKIGELEAFKNKINDMIISHEVRIKTISKDLEDIKFKYDREIIQNLLVPGFVGPSCQFKTISEYLLSNINEINKLKGDKDFNKKENKKIKTKMDSMMKNVFNLVDNSVTRCIEYTDSKQKNLESFLNSKLVEFNEKNMEMKTQVMSNQRMVQEEISKLFNLSEELLKMKDQINSMINNKYDELNVVMKEFKNRMEKVNNEIKKNNKNYENITNILKRSGMSINTNTISNKTNYKTMNSKAQGRHSFMKINNKYNTMSNNTNKNEESKKEDKIERKHKKNNTIIQRQKYEMNDSLKTNRTIENNSSLKNKKRKSLSINDFNSINNSKFKNSESKKYKRKSIFTLKNNINKPNHNDLFNKKNEKNSLNKIKDNLSKEREIKLIQKKINKKKENNINITSSEEETNNKKIEEKSSKFFEKIESDNNNSIIQITSNISNKSNKSNKNENIYNLKKTNLFKRKQNISLDSRNNLLLDKLCETNRTDKFDENSKNNNNKINNISTLYKYKKEPILITQKINSIKYPNEQIINQINKKDDLFHEFLEKHNLILNNSSDYKPKNNNSKNNKKNIINNKIFGTANDAHNYYDNNFSNNIKIEYKNLTIREREPSDIKKKNTYTKVNKRRTIYNNNMDTPENIHYKLISLDNKYHTSLNNKKYKTRNKLELVLPITNIFETFQVKKYKNIINNITEDFPTKISPIFGRTGYSIYNKKDEKYKNFNNINIYKKSKNNQSQPEINLGLTPTKKIKIYT